MTRVSVIIPTYNEELNLPGCLRSLTGWSDDVWVLDSFSTDRTTDIARAAGAHVAQHSWEGFAEQKNWALSNLPLAHGWVLILDADERISPELAKEIQELLARDGSGCDGFYLNRRFMFYGRWIRHCGWYPSWNLRLFRRGRARYEHRRVHEHLVLEGKAGYCRHDLIHEDLRDLSHWIEKHNRYSSLEAEELQRARQGKSAELRPSLFGGPLERKRFVKEHLWPHLPARPLLFFLYMYVFRLGFLDGMRGLHFCCMHACFQYFCSMKLWETKHRPARADAHAGQ